MLARTEPLNHLRGVLVMPRRNHDETERRVPEHIVQVRRQHLDPLVAREVAALRAAVADDAAQEEAIGPLGHLRREHGIYRRRPPRPGRNSSHRWPVVCGRMTTCVASAGSGRSRWSSGYRISTPSGSVPSPSASPRPTARRRPKSRDR